MAPGGGVRVFLGGGPVDGCLADAGILPSGGSRRYGAALLSEFGRYKGSPSHENSYGETPQNFTGHGSDSLALRILPSFGYQ